MKTWNLRVSEEELRALIRLHAGKMVGEVYNHDTETSSRIHDLTKRLNKGDASEGENGESKVEEKKPDPWSGA